MDAVFANSRYPLSAGYAVRTDACAAGDPQILQNSIYGEPAIGCVLDGCFDYYGERQKVLAAPGTILFGRTGENFSVRHSFGCDNRRLVAFLDTSLLSEAANDCNLDSPHFPNTAIPAGMTATRIFGLIHELSLNRPDYEDALFRLIDVAYNAPAHAEWPHDKLSQNARKRLQETARLLNTMYAEPWTLASMAQSAGMSRFHFTRQFRSFTGISPNRYLINIRLRAAAGFLLSSNTPIASIAADVGFNDISNFYSCFRSVFGKTPRKFRLQNSAKRVD